MDTKELLKKVRKIEIKTRRLSDNLFGGEYQSTFKGRGMTFSEVRQYNYGDDVRSIDWNVTARYNEPFVKVFEEERELTLMLIVDVSGSEMFGTKTQLKKEIITEISATLAFSALQNNDKVGLLLFSNQVELYIPPKKGKSHILRIIRELLEFKPKNKLTDINISLEFLSGILKKKSIVFVLSDFMDDKYEKTLSIMAKKHDLTGIRVFDPKDELIPNLGLIQINDSETGEIKWINTQSSSVRKAYSNHYHKNVSFFESVLKKNGVGILSCRVDESYVKKLLNFFNSRG
ncbi:MAG: DUF58 domain-containing protein [Flavobacteriaceae bacterium]|nr:DUF58 domain-containing protein [Flavobacteriaceae bacterium]|tara:strand:- start:4243 stop:5109 length:867 start_codon:yes stop_codon:yes gene_type:complete